MTGRVTMVSPGYNPDACDAALPVATGLPGPARIVLWSRTGGRNNGGGEMKRRPVKKEHKDPVCGMEVSVTTAAAAAEYHGKTYFFCAAMCRDRFVTHPEHYVGRWHGAGHLQRDDAAR